MVICLGLMAEHGWEFHSISNNGNTIPVVRYPSSRSVDYTRAYPIRIIPPDYYQDSCTW